MVDPSSTIAVPGIAGIAPDVPAAGQLLPARASTVEVRDWADLAMDPGGRAALESGLADMGFPADVVAGAMGIRDEGTAQVDDAVAGFWDDQRVRYREAPDDVLAAAGRVREAALGGALERLRGWFGDQVVLMDRARVDLRLGIFVLASPAVTGAKVEFEKDESREQSLDLSLEIAGSGLSGNAKITTSVACTFTASGGEVQLVFLPITVLVDRFVSKSGRERFRVNLDPLGGAAPTPGLTDLSAAARPAPGPRIDGYLLAGSSAAEPSKFARTYSQSKAATLSIGFEAFGAKLGVTCGTTIESKLGLAFTLPNGRDYQLHRPESIDGVLWA